LLARGRTLKGMTENDVQVSLTSFGSIPQPATAVVIEQSPGERFVRALAGLGMFWGLALVGLFIPVAHFILVPGFGVGGVVTAARRMREDRRLALVRGACPRCAAAQEFKVGGRFVSGRSLNCPKCHANLTLVAAPAAT
jgi:hypothetical protein